MTGRRINELRAEVCRLASLKADNASNAKNNVLRCNFGRKLEALAA